MTLKIALFYALTVTVSTSALAQKAADAPGGKYAKEAEQSSVPPSVPIIRNTG
ncbi:MAG: hypothetical protein U0989_06745 [Azonexus sp.]|nr:hypothetical protein [Azonexus sp.]MDZ4314447.1 hypothetical protein [Azonexus sp.]